MKHDLKILQLVDTLLPGGTERMCVNLTNLFTEKKIQNAVAVTRKTEGLKNLISPGTTVYSGNKMSRWDLRSFIQLYQFTKQYQPDILHAHSTTLFWAILLKLLSPRIKIIWHDHLGSRKSSSENPLIILLSTFISGSISVNHLIHDWHIKNLIINKKNIIQLNNFTLFKRVDHQNHFKPEMIYSATILPVKNQLNLLKALEILKERGTRFHCHFAGKIADEAYYEKLKCYISDNQLEPFITLHGQVDDINLLLSKVSIGIIASNSEGMPLSLLEYGMSGLAVVSTHVGECANLLQHGKAGWVVPPSDSLALSAALEEMLTHQPMAIEKSGILRNFIQNNYGPDQFYKGYSLLLHHLKQKSQ